MCAFLQCQGRDSRSQLSLLYTGINLQDKEERRRSDAIFSRFQTTTNEPKTKCNLRSPRRGSPCPWSVKTFLRTKRIADMCHGNFIRAYPNGFPVLAHGVLLLRVSARDCNVPYSSGIPLVE
jgi:hypothetical protein